MYVYIQLYIYNYNKNSNNFIYLQVAKSPSSRLRFEVNFSKERSCLYKARSRPDESN